MDLNIVKIEDVKVNGSSVFRNLTSLFTETWDTLPIILHNEVNENLKLLEDSDEEFDDYEKLFNYVAKNLNIKELNATFKKHKAKGVKYLITYKKSENGEADIEFLKYMECVRRNVKRFQEKVNDSEYFRKKSNHPETKLQTLADEFMLLKSFLEEIIKN